MRTGGLHVLWLALAPAGRLLGRRRAGGLRDDRRDRDRAPPESTTGEAEDAPTTVSAGRAGRAGGDRRGRGEDHRGEDRPHRDPRARRRAGGQERFGGQGRFDFERRAGEMTPRLIEGEAGAGVEVTAVFVDSSVYYQLPPGALPGAGADPARPPERRRCVEPRLRPARAGSQADPTQYLLWLSALGPGITKIGEDVRGVPTSRYRAAVDLNLLEEQARPARRPSGPPRVQTLRDRLGLAFIPVEVWVDDEGLIRRFNHEYGFSTEGTTAVVTTELSTSASRSMCRPATRPGRHPE